MTIIKKPQTIKASSEMDAFISGAPDATIPRRVHKGSKVQITLTIAEPLLLRIDTLAEQLGQSRAALINLAVVQMLATGLRIDGVD